MRTFSPQYEHVPDSNEEHTVSSNTPRPLSYGSPQPHETVELRSWGRQEERIPESYQSFQHARDSSLHVDAEHDMNQSFDSWNPKGTTSIDIQPLRQKNERVTTGWLNDWWWWEIGSVVLSLSCIIAIIVTLLVMQNKPLSSWHSSIAPNALISVGKVEN
jgi:hypothetical protein